MRDAVSRPPRLFQKTRILLIAPLVATLLAAGVSAPAPAASAAATEPPPESAACFAETGQCVRGLFYAYWAENGGLLRQGYPLTAEFDEVSPTDGKTYRVQYFERARFEYHQEHVNTPAVVLFGLLGREQFAARYPQSRPAGGTGEVCFEQTGRCARGAFYAYWARNGGLAQFGYPLSDEFAEVNADDGRPYLVQYFERARFEYHPEHAGTPHEVLLGLTGREQLAARYPHGQPAARTDPAINVWAATTGGLHPAVADLPARVYVPDERGASVTVIDPATFAIVDRYPTGRTPHHVGPSPDLTKLYVNNMDSNTLTEIDARGGRPTRQIPAAVPYNLYFTPDGTKAIVAAEPVNRLDFYDPQSWQLLGQTPLPCSGVDHADFSADGRYLLVSCEFDGQVMKVDVVNMTFLGAIRVGGLPVDIKLAPDGAVFYVANQGRHGVSIVDPVGLREIGFLPTGAGAHGMAISRDTRTLYVSNRLAGTISVIDFASRSIVATWQVGGSPDMLQVSTDGTQLWASGRFHGAVYVIDTASGRLLHAIPTGAAPHGLTFFPQPGQRSLGHNGVYR